MANNETNTEPKNIKNRVFQIVFFIAICGFAYNQYIERQEKAAMGSYTTKDVGAAMDKVKIHQQEIAKKKKEALEAKEAKAAAEKPVEAPPVQAPIIKEVEIKPYVPPIEEVKPVVIEAPVVKVEPKKIIDENIYTPPPEYGYAGKGLVYNCSGKHWACVDGIAYTACKRNMTWNRNHKKTAECVVQEVYTSKADCEIMQTQNISQATSTAFCSPNKNSKNIKAKY